MSCGFCGAEAVGLGAGFEDGRVVGDAVDDGGDEAGVGEDGSPFTEGQVCPDGDGGFFVAIVDELGKLFRRLRKFAIEQANVFQGR